MNNLVIGSDGFVGQPFCAFLEKQGEHVTRFDIKRHPDEDARHAKWDLRGIDRVYFLAWEVGGAKYLYRDDVQSFQLTWNMRLMLNIFPQLEAARIPFLFVSSQLAQECDTVYGITKRLGETWTKLLDGVRVRLWNVYGPLEPVTARSHVIADFVTQAVTAGEIQMLTDGEERRQFIHIDDVCSALHCAMEDKLTGVYDVSSFEWRKVIDVATVIARLCGATIVRGRKPGNTPDTPMIGKLPGWQPRIDLHAGLRQMVRTLADQICPAAALPVASREAR